MDAVDAGKPPPVESRPALASLARELRNSFSSLSLSMDRGSVSVRRASWDVGREVVQKEPKVVETNDGRSSTADRPGHAKKASLSAPRPASSSSYRNSYALPPPQLHTSLASDSQAAPNSAPVTSNSRIPSPQFSTAPSPNNRIPSPQFSTAPSPLPTQSPSPSPTSPVHPTPSNIMHQFPPPPGPYGHARPMLGPPPFGLPMYPSNGRPPYPSVSRYGPPPPHHPQSHSPQPIHPQHPLPPPHHPYYQTLPHAMTMPRPPAPFQGGMVMGATAPGMGHGGLYGPQAPLSPPSPYGTLQSSQSPQFRPHRNVQQNNNTSFQSQHSANTSQTSQTSQAARSAILSQSQGESLELYRQTAKKSNDPQVQLDFVKHLIAVADAAQPDPTDPKKQKKIQDAMYTEAAKWVKKLAASGGIGSGKSAYSDAQFFLAECYGNGSLHLPVDHDKAFGLYVQASKQAHPAATYRTAVCYEVGAGTKRDSARAMQFYRKAAALGDTAAMYKVGMILMNGLLGQVRNPREGVTWLKRAAAQADEATPHALHELAVLYEGTGPDGVVIPDPTHSHELFLRAAQFGYAPSQQKLGYCYEYGHLNLPIDPRRSIAWYTRAAEQQEPEAELSLSGWYLTGAEGVLRQSDKEAYLWARKAADKGLAKAEYAVGYYSEHGVGVPPDLEEARRWYLRAAAQGHRRSIQRVKEIKSAMLGGSGRGGGDRAGEWRKSQQAKDGECVVM